MSLWLWKSFTVGILLPSFSFLFFFSFWKCRRFHMLFLCLPLYLLNKLEWHKHWEMWISFNYTQWKQIYHLKANHFLGNIESPSAERKKIQERRKGNNIPTVSSSIWPRLHLTFSIQTTSAISILFFHYSLFCLSWSVIKLKPSPPLLNILNNCL